MLPYPLRFSVQVSFLPCFRRSAVLSGLLSSVLESLCSMTVVVPERLYISFSKYHVKFDIQTSTLCQYCITKTCLYNFDPLKSHFYIVKLGFTGVYIIILISVQNIDCGYLLEPPRRGGSNEYLQSMF